MKLFGVCALLFAALFISGEFGRYERRRLSELEGFLKLLEFVRREISCSLRPIGAWSLEFENEALTRVGFLAVLREEENLGAAYLSVEKELSVGVEEKKLLRGFAEGFGRAYRDEELKRIDRYAEELDRALSSDKREIPRVGRLVRTLCLSLALAVAILLL